MSITEAEKRVDEILRAFLREKEYFHERLSAIEPDVNLTPFRVQLVTAEPGSDKSIKIFVAIHKLFNPAKPAPEILDALHECMEQLKKHPELAPFEFQTKLIR